MPKADFQPDWFSKPGDTVAALMEKRQIDATVLAEQMGEQVAVIRGLLAGRVQIDDSLAAQLSTHIGGAPSFWHARQRQFEEALAHAADAVAAENANTWLKALPLRDMIRADWIPPSKGTAALKAALTYFDVANPQEWRERYASFSNMFSFRTSPAFESKIASLAVWLRQGEIEAETVACQPWDAECFRVTLTELRRLTRLKLPSSFVPRLRTLCSDAGIAVVFVPAPAGCRASGATRFISPTKAMVILSFRYLSDDHFWFTFFHEAGHLLLHGPDKTFVDGSVSEDSDKEAAANAFAASTLISSSQFDAMMRLKPRSIDVIKFARSLGVSPGIVVGQMQHQGIIGRHQLNSLKRRYSWDAIQAALT